MMDEVQRPKDGDVVKTRSKNLPKELGMQFNWKRPMPTISLQMSLFLGLEEVKDRVGKEGLGGYQHVSGRLKSPRRQRGVLGNLWIRMLMLSM